MFNVLINFSGSILSLMPATQPEKKLLDGCVTSPFPATSLSRCLGTIWMTCFLFSSRRTWVSGISGCCWSTTFALQDRVLTCICRSSNKLFRVFQSVPTFWCPSYNHLFLLQSRLRGQRSGAFFSFRPCPLLCRDPLDSLNFLMMWLIGDDEIPKFQTTVPWEMTFLHCWAISLLPIRRVLCCPVLFFLSQESN